MSLASLQRNNRRIAPMLNNWVDEPDVTTRLVNFGTEYLQSLYEAGIEDLLETSTVKSGSSMAPALIHQSNASIHNPPSLRSYCTDSTPTETSICTGLAGTFSGVPLLVERNNDGILEIPDVVCPTPMFECVFWFLNCDYTFVDKEEWEVHCASHLRGEEPPQTAQCPLCDWTVTCEFGKMAWDMRMEHIAYDHVMQGQTLQRTSRPDFHLFEFLWQRRLIDDEDLKELKGGNHNLSHPPANFVETAGRRRDRDGRRHRTQHVRAPRQPVPRRS
ncbi:hypothetical protein Ptr902_03530 [Pyrenophora tritici-repentis]|nr:hypothetical protein Ptr902_03530 [Pyrenophora tritici-repentis]